MPIKRREAREILVTLLYETGFETIGAEGDRTPESIYENAIKVREIPDDEFVRNIYFDLWAHQYEIDALIENCSKGWKEDRRSRVSNAILRLATYEMTISKLPFPIAINEAIELAKKYDYDKSPKFINGVLNKIAEETGLKEKSTEE